MSNFARKLHKETQYYDRSFHTPQSGEMFLDDFQRLCANLIKHESDFIKNGILGKIQALRSDYDKTRSFTRQTWLRFYGILETVSDMSTNIAFFNDSRELESSQSVDAWKYDLGINMVSGYLNHLQTEIDKLQSISDRMKARGFIDLEDTTIEHLKEEVTHMNQILLTEFDEGIDERRSWLGLRGAIDDVKARIIETNSIMHDYEQAQLAREKAEAVMF